VPQAVIFIYISTEVVFFHELPNFTHPFNICVSWFFWIKDAPVGWWLPDRSAEIRKRAQRSRRRMLLIALLLMAIAFVTIAILVVGARADERREDAGEASGSSPAIDCLAFSSPIPVAEKLCPKTAFRDFTAVQASPLPANTQLVLQLL